MRRGRLLKRIATGLLVAATGCGEGEPRPQLIVEVDTDLPLSGQLLFNDELSPDAAVDTIRIDALREEDGVLRSFDLRTLAVPTPDDWPVSFGVAAGELGSAVLVRVRLFRAQFAVGGETSGRTTLDPMPQVTVDRLVSLSVPDEGLERVSLLLTGDCLGSAADFGQLRSCVDADRPSATPDEGLVEEPSGETRAGTWPAARYRGCAGDAPAGAQCIPGGFFVLGDERYVGVSDDATSDSMPLRAVVLSPFFLDVHELTVGRLEQLRADGYAGALPNEANPNDAIERFCTWYDDGSGDDALPVNCLHQQLSAQICEAAGGSLPSEAQWEYVARGRGQRRLFPWGNEQPECCTASLGRLGDPSTPVQCSDESGMEPVGSHPAADTCGGRGDVTRDGIHDMAGSVAEALLDELRPLDAPCWAKALSADPVCEESGLFYSSRGSYWNAGLATSATPWRRAAIIGPAAGFRCAYRAEAAP